MSVNKDNTRLWMVPYADLMTVLVILFLSLYGFSFNIKKSDYEAAMARMQKELGVRGAAKKIEEIQAARQVEEDLKKQIREGNLGVEITTARIKLTFSSPVLFDSGSAELKDLGLAALGQVAKRLIKMENQVTVEGHTDAARMLGKKFSSNRQLSLMRSFSVIDYLIRSGVPPRRLTAFGYGEFRPLAPNDTEANRARNRRIEIIIMRQETNGEKKT